MLWQSLFLAQYHMCDPMSNHIDLVIWTHVIRHFILQIHIRRLVRKWDLSFQSFRCMLIFPYVLILLISFSLYKHSWCKETWVWILNMSLWHSMNNQNSRNDKGQEAGDDLERKLWKLTHRSLGKRMKFYLKFHFQL